jgi:hypothetical protein
MRLEYSLCSGMTPFKMLGIATYGHSFKLVSQNFIQHSRNIVTRLPREMVVDDPVQHRVCIILNNAHMGSGTGVYGNPVRGGVDKFDFSQLITAVRVAVCSRCFTVNNSALINIAKPLVYNPTSGVVISYDDMTSFGLFS